MACRHEPKAPPTRTRRYLLQGVRFHMPGRWLFEFGMTLGEDIDGAAIEFEL